MEADLRYPIGKFQPVDALRIPHSDLQRFSHIAGGPRGHSARFPQEAKRLLRGNRRHLGLLRRKERRLASATSLRWHRISTFDVSSIILEQGQNPMRGGRALLPRRMRPFYFEPMRPQLGNGLRPAKASAAHAPR